MSVHGDAQETARQKHLQGLLQNVLSSKEILPLPQHLQQHGMDGLIVQIKYFFLLYSSSLVCSTKHLVGVLVKAMTQVSNKVEFAAKQNHFIHTKILQTVLLGYATE